MTTSFYGVDLGDQGASAAAPTTEVLAVFEFMKPKATNTPLIRIGGNVDGSYLVPDELDGIGACFSPGANRIKHFEDYLADHYGIASHMCDFSCDVEEFRTPLKPGMQTFAKKWLDISPNEDSISLEDWVAEHNPSGDLLLQIDIEGAEYRNILATPDETLARFRIIVLEVHGLRKMLDAPTLRGAIAPFFQKLGRSFTTIHAHPNNCCGDFEVPGTDLRIPKVLELTLIRNDWFVPALGPASLPHPLDISQNVTSKPPLFLSDAWCGQERSLESRIRMLEETLRYRDKGASVSANNELSSALALSMQSIQTLTDMIPRERKKTRGLVEVAHGRPYQLSSSLGASNRKGVVQGSNTYFFHTGFGPSQSIRIDLGHRRQVRRIVITNRRNGYQERAKHLFAVLTEGGQPAGTHVFPMYKNGQPPSVAWKECAIDLPDVPARYVTITSPLNTALHFADLEVFALAENRALQATAKRVARRIVSGVRARASRLSRRE